MIKNIVNFSKDHIFSNIGDILKTKHIAIRVKRCSFCRYVCFSHFVSFSKRSIWLKSTFCSKKGICGRIPFRSLPQPDRTIRFCTIAKNRPRLFFFLKQKSDVHWILRIQDTKYLGFEADRVYPEGFAQLGSRHLVCTALAA